jgi:hypothetical protein
VAALGLVTDPTWIAVVAAFSPLAVAAAGVAGVLIGGWWTRKGTKEADNRGRREQLMTHFRYSLDCAKSRDPRTAKLGVDQLGALYESDLFSDSEKALIDAGLRSVLHEPQAEIEAAETAGEDIRVVQVNLRTIEAAVLPLEDDDEAAAEDNGEEDGRGA